MWPQQGPGALGPWVGQALPAQQHLVSMVLAWEPPETSACGGPCPLCVLSVILCAFLMRRPTSPA